MSQPPPPPSPPPNLPSGSGDPNDPQSDGPSLEKKPEAGGYGYPQAPTQAGGYGYPQAPPGGYGYPQAPPGPPGGPSGGPGGQQIADAPTQFAPGAFGQQQQPTPPYGQPPQAPGPYGQPPYAPGPYGQPPHPGQHGPMATTMPGGPMGAPGGSGGNNRLVVIIAAVVAVLLVAGGGIWYLSQDDKPDDPQASTEGTTSGGEGGNGGAPPGEDGKLLFTVDAPQVKDLTAVPGAWSTKKYFVKSSVRKVVGVNAQDGSAAWEIPLAGEVCAASPHQTKDDKTALVTRETISSDADCNQLVVIDLDKGKKLWQETIPGDADLVPSSDGVTISEGTIALSWTGGSAGYKISGGDPIWAGEPTNKCRDDGFAGGAKLVVVQRCGYFSDAKYVVQTLDPNTGKPVGEFDVPAGIKNVSIASTDPLVLVISAGGTYQATDVMTIDDNHKLAGKIALGERYHAPCRGSIEGCWTVAANDKYVFLATETTRSSGEQTNSVMAFDFNSGATKWKVDAGAKRTIMPIGMDGEKLLAYRTSTYDEAGEIVGIDTGTQKETTLLGLPGGNDLSYEKELAPDTYSSDAEVIFEHGRLFFTEARITERTGVYTKERLMAVGYGG